ncbi:mate-domain-containing protein [Radiomyces spectabilis]|uniref:mate-domain-containing protein n=1 Tax=Radiomyces spectabilis TaxID=64574 RepID=UPI0022210F78|nr:mate-domain-containing protein [Radiomyces spectabilis]KAI8381460.1 mate-domain-containing protein [Radiomyces spectabilis]
MSKFLAIKAKEKRPFLFQRMTVTAGHKHEFKWLLKNAMPLVLSYLLQNSLQSVSVVSAGHLGPHELAAASLGSMFVTVTGISVATGATLALDTLCSQSFTSSDDKKIVGLHVQRCLAFLSLLYIPIAILWWYSESVFLLLRQDPTVAALASTYVRWMILAAPAFALFEALKKMLQAQGIFRAPTMTLLLIGAPLNLILSYSFVWSPSISLGFAGAPIASCFAQWATVIALIYYIYKYDGYQAWPQWSTRAAYDWHAWGPMIKLAIPGILLICTESWAYEIIALGASWIDTSSLGAQSIILTSITALYTLAFGVGVASANRVGNLLGAGKPYQAKIAAQTAIGLSVIIATINSSMLTLCRHSWARLFTSDAQVTSLVAKTLPLVAVFVFADNIAGVADGVLNGQGRQHVGALFNLGAYYLSSLPIGFYLCFRAQWGLLGLWSALAMSLIAACVATLAVVLTTDWQKEVRKAEDRTSESVKAMETHQQQPTANPASGYPGVVGGTPANQRGVQGYDAYGNPIIPPFIAQRHQIEQSLGPTCNGQYHELRMEYTNKTLLFAILILPYCCGWRGKRVVRSN